MRFFAHLSGSDKASPSGSNSSSLFPPLAAVVAVAPKGRALRPTPTLFPLPFCYPRERGVGLVRTVIYLDVLLLVNFVVGAAFLLAATALFIVLALVLLRWLKTSGAKIYAHL